ncbi:MAG: hypothetical protein CMF51_04815 [Legionellales bacterium]|nr:hypothetical protein [Legionellales bacterium]|tara:strand:- start:216 stop:476 length:261 start_codon:yes stop_codon:yes gene_type:complete
MPIRLRNPLRKTKKKSKSPRKVKKLLSSDERKRMTYLKTLLEKENRAMDITLGKSLKSSFEKFLTKKKHSKGRRPKKSKSKTHKKK